MENSRRFVLLKTMLLLAAVPLWLSLVQAAPDVSASAEREPLFAAKVPWMSDKDWLSLFDPPFTHPTDIPVGNDLRKVLFDQLRAKVQKKTEVRFLGELRAYKNWALFRGEALDIKDQPIYATDMPGVKVEDDPLANDNVRGLWLRTRNGWKLEDYGKIGCGELNDPITQYWADRYGMPMEFWGGYAVQVPEKERKAAFAFPNRVEISPGMGLRKELFDILRPEVERLYGKGMRFSGLLEGDKNWALFQGTTNNAKGQNVPEDGGDTVALWLRTCDGWILVDFNLGHTDVFYEIWKDKYGVPFFGNSKQK
jgi:hypothetical protein